MAPQQRDWTCSICAATWVLQATGIAPRANREDVAHQLGYPGCVNEAYGLMDTQCLVDLFAGYGVQTRLVWPTFDQAYAIAASTTGCLSGVAWYHWVAIRGVDGPHIWIANSARGYRGVYDTLNREQFAALGAFKVVSLVH